METKGKKKLMNLVMVLLILVIAASGVLTVGKMKGWFEKAEDALVLCGQTKGVVNIQRQGVGYTLKEETSLHSADVIETKKGAQVELIWKEAGALTLNEKTETTLTACSQEACEVLVSQGETYGDMLLNKEAFQMTFAGQRADLAEAVFSISVQAGSCSMNVYAGDVSVYLSDDTQERVEAGEYLSVTEQEDGSISYEIQKLQAASLNEFLITQMQNCDSAGSLCFATEDLQKVLDERAAEKQAALEAALQADKVQIAEETETETGELDADASETELQNAGEAADTAEAYTPEHTGSDQNTVSDQTVVNDAKICTISIVCDTILDNMENLDAGKEAYVPANGTILATSSVEFEDGETVFDVLNRVCEYAGIQIEYSWTPMYNSYYIEGLNNLYEFDCGNESGWMYKVNGWFPNYGCSSYTLEDGDNIVWCYTCNGLGADVGGPVY